MFLRTEILNARGTVETGFGFGYDEICFGTSDSHSPDIFLSAVLQQSFTTVKNHCIDFPKRSAIIAFSIKNLYELAEEIRLLYGGVSVVLGSLSPKARNAQVQMFEKGEVDYIVSTDAIGMGLI